jgi:hypothetical protein
MSVHVCARVLVYTHLVSLSHTHTHTRTRSRTNTHTHTHTHTHTVVNIIYLLLLILMTGGSTATLQSTILINLFLLVHTMCGEQLVLQVVTSLLNLV